MKLLKPLFFFFFLIFVSCSRVSFQKNIKDPLKDSLRNESLNRQGKKRLLPFITNNSPKKNVSQCHLNLFEQGIQGLRMDFDIRKEGPELWNELGLCFFLKGENSRAYYYFNVSLEKINTNKSFKSRPYNNLGLVFIEWENYPKAIESFKKALKYHPEARVPRYNLAQVFLKLGDPLKAKLYLDEIPGALEDDDFYISRGFADLLKKEYKNALEKFQRVSIPKNKRHDIALYRSYSFLKMGKIKMAKASLLKKDESNNKVLLLFEKGLQKEISEFDKEDKNESK